MKIFDQLPKPVRVAIANIKIGGNVEDLRWADMKIKLGQSPRACAREIINMTDQASARRFQREQQSLEQFPLQWKLKRAPP